MISPEVKKYVEAKRYGILPNELPESAEKQEALADALIWHRWCDSPVRTWASDFRVGCALSAAARLDTKSALGGRRVLRAALANPNLRELADRAPGIACRGVLDILEYRDGHIGRKTELVEDLSESGLLDQAAVAGEVLCYDQMTTACMYDVLHILGLLNDPPSGDAHDLAATMLRTGLLSSNPRFREWLCGHIHSVMIQRYSRDGRFSQAAAAAMQRTIDVIASADTACAAPASAGSSAE